jgi:hypothetical protein
MVEMLHFGCTVFGVFAETASILRLQMWKAFLKDFYGKTASQ